jgi:hypothetical protein
MDGADDDARKLVNSPPVRRVIRRRDVLGNACLAESEILRRLGERIGPRLLSLVAPSTAAHRRIHIQKSPAECPRAGFGKERTMVRIRCVPLDEPYERVTMAAGQAEHELPDSSRECCVRSGAARSEQVVERVVLVRVRHRVGVPDERAEQRFLWIPGETNRSDGLKPCAAIPLNRTEGARSSVGQRKISARPYVSRRAPWDPAPTKV